MFDSDKEEKRKRLKENMSKIRDMIGGKEVEKPDLEPESMRDLQREPETRERETPKAPEPPKEKKQQKGSVKNLEIESETEREVPEIPEPPKTKEISVPNIEKGPLFITKQKFFEANNRVKSMRNLSDELRDHLDELEGTLKEDEDTTSSLEGLLSDFQGNIRNLKEIVSP